MERRQVLVGEPGALQRLWWWLADLLDLFWVRGVLVALVAWLFLVGLSSLDYFAYQDVPVEDAVVVSVETSQTETVACGRVPLFERPAEVVTYRSLTRREGYPDVFWEATCPGVDEEVGDVIRVLRTGVGPDHVFPHPVETAAQLWTWPLGYALVIGLGAGVLFFLREAWQVTTWHGRWKRHTAPRPEAVKTAERRMAAKRAPRRGEGA